MNLEYVKELLVLLIGSSLVSNVVLSQFLGLCPFLGVSRKTNTAAGMGAAGFSLFQIRKAPTARAAISTMPSNKFSRRRKPDVLCSIYLAPFRVSR